MSPISSDNVRGNGSLVDSANNSREDTTPSQPPREHTISQLFYTHTQPQTPPTHRGQIYTSKLPSIQ